MKQIGRDFAILGIVGCLIACGTLAGQSRDYLKQKFGEPISETFMLGSDVSVTATYATGGRIKELVVSPRNTDLIKSRGKTLLRASVTAIIDELVPNSTRGKRLAAELVNVSCIPDNDCNGNSETFEKIIIYYNSAAKGHVHYAVVQWRE